MKRIYQVNDEIIFHDPDDGMLEALQAIEPGFRPESVKPPHGFIPKYQSLRSKKFRMDGLLFDLSTEELKAVIDEDVIHHNGEYEYSLFDVLHVLSLKAISECRLCGWECGVNRYEKPGKCGLGRGTFASKPFKHIAEEQPINPAVVVNFAGCSMCCCYCMDHELWKHSACPETDAKEYWKNVQELFLKGILPNSIEFTNPTESLHGVYALLKPARSDLSNPVVMNCHDYGSEGFYELAGPVTDVWLPDLRYGNDKCARELSGVDNYMKYAKLGLNAMTAQDARTIVRILVLPGHVECCHEPAIEFLSEYKDRIWVSILDQYVPEHEAYKYPELNRRPTPGEISRVENLVDSYGLRNIAHGCCGFWN